MSPQLRLELLRLFAALCDGELTEPQHARLHSLLEGDAACRRLYLAYVDMHAHLLVHPFTVAGHTADAEAATASPVVSASLPDDRPRWRQAGRYAAVIVATLALSLLAQVLLRPAPVERASDPRNAAAKTAPAATKTPLPPYVATLTQTPDSVWLSANGPAKVGPRLLPGLLRLQKGVARLRFDTGSDLVIEGPAEVRVDSSTSVTLFQGKVVCRADETGAAFDLHTPSATLVNADGEYAVSVDDGGEEVHVFDGEVQRTPRTGAAAPEVLAKGEAWSYGPTPEKPRQPKTLDEAGFVRQLSNAAAPADPSAGLLAYEGFDYSSGDVLQTGKANGGVGWTSPWQRGFARPLIEGDTNKLALNPTESLVRPSAAVPAVGGCFDYVGFAKYHRCLATSVRLDTDGVYYLSFLFRRAGPQLDDLNALAILLRTTEELQKGKDDARKRLNIGVGGANQLFTHLDKVGSRTPVPLRYGETYLLVAKIVASNINPSQVFMRVYGPEEPIEREESGGWTVAGPPFHSKLVFDWMEIHINSRTRQTIDEIRLGVTWSSVTAPWIGAGAKKVGKQ